VARIAANHLRELQQMQSSAAPNPRDVEVGHIANMFKAPVSPEHAEPASVKKHVTAVSPQPVTSSSVAASAAAASKHSPRPSASTLPRTPQQAHPGSNESESGAAVTKLSEELVI